MRLSGDRPTSTLTARIQQPIIGVFDGDTSFDLEFPMLVTGTSSDGRDFTGDLRGTQYLFDWRIESGIADDLVWNGTVGWAGGRYELTTIAGARLFPVTIRSVAWTLDFNIVPDWDQLDTAAGGDVIVPNASWIAQAGIPVAATAAQDFFSLDPGADVLTGTSLSGFSFTSSHAPGQVDYFEFGALGESARGTTVGPVGSAPVIPEPSTFAVWSLLSLTVGGACGWPRRRGA